MRFSRENRSTFLELLQARLRRRSRRASLLSAVFSVALAVRVASVIVDHAASRINSRLIAIESVVLLACLAVLLFDEIAAWKDRHDGLRST